MNQKLGKICLKVAGVCMIASGILALIIPKGIQVHTCIFSTILFGVMLLKANYGTKED